MTPQPSMWIDITSEGEVGIECDDKSLTFDGHYVMIFPRGKNDDGIDGAMKRAEEILKFMRGRRQISR